MLIQSAPLLKGSSGWATVEATDHRNLICPTPNGPVPTFAAALLESELNLRRDEIWNGRKEWILQTPCGTTTYRAEVRLDVEPAVLECTIGVTRFGYQLRCLGDLHRMLVARDAWVELGIKDEKGLPPEGSVEAWARSPENPVGGWYGLKVGWRGRFAAYAPPLLEHLGFIELEHTMTGNRTRAIPRRESTNQLAARQCARQEAVVDR